MQNMYTDCYDRAIASLQKYKSLESEESIGILQRAIVKLEEQKENSLIEDKLKKQAPVVLTKIRASNRLDATVMRIITDEFFNLVATEDGQFFEKLAPDVYTLNTKSGVYTFNILYNSDFKSILLIRKSTNSGRDSQSASFVFDRLPMFVSTEKDLNTIEKNFSKMLKKLARCWKYLRSEVSPSQSTSIPSSHSLLSQEDYAEILSESLDNVQ